MANIKQLNPFNGVFGLPPSTWISDEMVVNSMPILEIVPCKPHYESGLNLFRLDEVPDTYLKILGNHGFATQVPIKCAFLADNFPTDSFTNNYTETYLQKFTDVASQGMSQLAQMAGADTGIEAAGKFGKLMTDIGGEMGGAAGGLMSGAGSAAQSTAAGLDKLIKRMQSGEASGLSKLMGGGAALISKMVAGQRVDFPQVWVNSGFTPSYTATIRLYNPNPGNKASTEEHIAGPLAVLLCLAVPRSDDGKTYNWPFFHKIKSTGIYNLNPAVITNITVIKGGDQQQIAYNQNLGIVDVRLDFSSLYNSMLVEEGKNTFTNRPTVRNYIKSLTESDAALYTKRNKINQVVGDRAGINLLTTRVHQPSIEELIHSVKNAAAKQRQAPKVVAASEQNRVPHDAFQTQNDLVTDTDASFIPHL